MSEITEKPKLTILEKEKLNKEQILQTKYQREFLLEQNKLKRAEIERTELIVKEQEVSARSWRAYYDKMFYSMECEILQPLYTEYQQRAKKKLEKDNAEYDEMQKKLQETLNAESKELGNSVELLPVPEISELQTQE